MKKNEVVGINIQFPISQLIIDGQKTVETRTYPMPTHFIGKTVAIVETPGKSGKFKSRVVALAVFEESFKYKSKSEFYADIDRHKVDKNSPWAWKDEKGKWGWPVKVTRVFPRPIEVHKRLGIKFTYGIPVN